MGFEDKNRKTRSSYRDAFILRIQENPLFKIDVSDIKSRDECEYVDFYIDYPKEVDLESNLRNGLKVELSFKPTYLPAIKKKIASFASEFISDAPVESAANKFSALLWRIDIKDRSEPYNHMTNDPALMRHLYDLSALYTTIQDDVNFVKLVKDIFEKDKNRGKKDRDVSLNDFIAQTIKTLETDNLYRKEYDSFVSTMCYGNNTTDFKTALNKYKKICQIVTG